MMSNQWRFHNLDELLKNCPSLQTQHFPSSKDELLMRAKGARFTFDCGSELVLPQHCISTACLFMHRFFMRNSFKEHHVYNIAASCLFLACKVEENTRKIGDFILRIARVSRKDNTFTLRETDKEYTVWHNILINNEKLIVEALCFDFSSISHPYALLDQILADINDASSLVDVFLPLKKIAWAFVSDSYKSVVCLLYPRNIVAYSAVLLAISFISEYPDLFHEACSLCENDLSDVKGIHTYSYGSSISYKKYSSIIT